MQNCARSSIFVLLAAVLAPAAVGPACAGPPFRTDDPEPVEYRHWEVYGFSTGTKTADDSAAILPGVEVNYGAAPGLQLHVIVPLSIDSPNGGGVRYGPGDVELGAKYRLIESG